MASIFQYSLFSLSSITVIIDTPKITTRDNKLKITIIREN